MPSKVQLYQSLILQKCFQNEWSRDPPYKQMMVAIPVTASGFPFFGKRLRQGRRVANEASFGERKKGAAGSPALRSLLLLLLVNNGLLVIRGRTVGGGRY